MAETKYDICNRVLSSLGQTVQITSFTGDVVSVQCGLWYDKLRQRLIRTAPWGFCRFQLTLTQTGDLIPDNTSPYPFLWQYAYPSDCLKFRYLLPPPIPPEADGSIVPPVVGDSVLGPTWYGPSRANRFVLHTNKAQGGALTRVILANVQNALGVYSGDVDDPNIFDELFVDALESSLAFKLVMPLTGNAGMRDEFKNAAEEAIIKARAVDGNEAVPSSDIKVDWIETRGVGSPWGFAPWGDNGWGSWYGQWDDMNWSM